MLIRKTGFTLIELTVVVVIMSILAALLIPRMITKLASGEPDQNGKVELDAEQPPDAAVASAPRTGALPVIESLVLEVELEASEERIGMDVGVRYDADVTGEVSFRAPAGAQEPVCLDVPFPEGTDEVEDLVLVLQGDSGSHVAAPEEIEITRSGFRWLAGSMNPGAVRASYAFRVRGRERFVCHLPAAQSLQRVEVNARLSGASPIEPMGGGLRPRSTSADSLHWSYANLVADRPIGIQLPRTESPVARAVLLFKLAGLAVLLFGIGFKYLGDLHRPGRLDTFRWGHFLLLALTFFFFFIAFGVLSFRGLAPGVSIGVAVALSLPLLVVHVGAIFDRAFALRYALPLAGLSIGVVANGVYGGDARAYVFVGLAFVVVAYLTLTFGKLQDRRGERAAQRRSRLAAAMDSLREPSRSALETCESARVILEVLDPDILREPRQEVARRAEELRGRHTEAGLLSRSHEDAENVEERQASGARLADLHGQVAPLRTALLRGTQSLGDAIRELQKRRRATREQVAQGDKERLHCPCCGQDVLAGRFCPSCGKPAPRELRCRRCDGVDHLSHLAKSIDLSRLHCMRCGESYETPAEPAA